jgi:surfactin synthase thioesterase subunit
VQYPGRGDRFGEPFGRSVHEAGAAVAEEIAARGLRNATLVGHSLGGIVAYEAAVRLTELGMAPQQLVVSSCASPGEMSHRTLHAAPDEEFWAGLAALGGIDAQIIESPELREVLSPILRSDLGLHARYEPRPGTALLACPVVCYQASSDPIVDDDGLDRWSAVTTGSFELRRVDGNHFHAFDDASRLVAEVTGELSTTTSDRRA